VDGNMYTPLSLGITTLVSLLGVIIGQIVTLYKVHKISKAGGCAMAVGGLGLGAAAAAKAGWFKTAWEFVKTVGGKIKDKFKDKAADKIADGTVETVETVVDEKVADKK
jgi:ABC-type transport system involved in cytochrome c biogenesis permease subunit